ncbi:MAG: hypothetical protein WD342_06360 [Verrucomicrobiales bacterium]
MVEGSLVFDADLAGHGWTVNNGGADVQFEIGRPIPNPGRLGNSELASARKKRYLRRQAEQLGFALTPVHGGVS